MKTKIKEFSAKSCLPCCIVVARLFIHSRPLKTKKQPHILLFLWGWHQFLEKLVLLKTNQRWQNEKTRSW